MKGGKKRKKAKKAKRKISDVTTVSEALKKRKELAISRYENYHDDYEDIDSETEDDEDRLRRLGIRLPRNIKEGFDMFTLTRTNQILQGISPRATDGLGPKQRKDSTSRKRSKKKRSKLKGAKRWIELVASELLSTSFQRLPIR